jgi:UDP-2,3-diacylglucosamine pyrophosphatase LpxH
MHPILIFDELHVISDLHLGGSSGRQIFDQGPVVAAMIRQLVALPRERKVGLVVNGDFVDFLAEPAATWFDPEGAVSRLERIAADPAFSSVFDALREFLQTPGRRLVLTLGNHDLELALPWVRERLMDLLSGVNEAAQSRITLAFDGAGFRCRVGSASVLCVHGNEVDEWNVTDHEQIRRIGRDIVQGRSPEAWKPNAGTRMVIEVMNEIKRDHPFVDLLKPEFQAAVPALLVIKPAIAGKIADIGKVALRLKWDSVKIRFGFLSAENSNHAELSVSPPLVRLLSSHPMGGAPRTREPSQEEVLRQLLSGGISATTSGAASPLSGADLLARAEQQMAGKRLPLELISTPEAEARLSVTDAVWKRMMGRDDAEVLRAALESVQNDRSFELDAEDETFRRLDALTGPTLRYVISGHTHLRRALPRSRGGGFYYNTGTWARLMQLTREHLENAADFTQVFAALKVPTLAALDQTPFVARHPTAACLEADGESARGSLREYALGPDGSLNVSTLPGSTFPSS